MLIISVASRIPPTPTTGPASQKLLAKSQLPTELQLYFTRLTSSLIPSSELIPPPPSATNLASTDGQVLGETERHRLAALASLRNDSAVSGLLVYIVKWVNESINKCLMGSLRTLTGLIDCMESLLDNQSLFLEPYVSVAPY